MSWRREEQAGGWGTSWAASVDAYRGDEVNNDDTPWRTQRRLGEGGGVAKLNFMADLPRKYICRSAVPLVHTHNFGVPFSFSGGIGKHSSAGYYSILALKNTIIRNASVLQIHNLAVHPLPPNTPPKQFPRPAPNQSSQKIFPTPKPTP